MKKRSGTRGTALSYVLLNAAQSHVLLFETTGGVWSVPMVSPTQDATARILQTTGVQIGSDTPMETDLPEWLQGSHSVGGVIRDVPFEKYQIVVCLLCLFVCV